MDWSERVTRSSQHLLGHAVRFTRELRDAGVTVLPAQTAVFAENLSAVNLLEPREFRDAARVTLISKREDLARFESAFLTFWRDLGLDGVPDELLGNLRLPPPKKPSQRPAEVRDTGAPKQGTPTPSRKRSSTER